MKNIKIFAFLAIFLLSAFVSSAWAWKGSGTSADPYQITSARDLAQLATDVNSGTSYSNNYFKQTANISLSGEWTPIGTSSHPFKGHYDGGHFAIAGLQVTGNYEHAGLFGYISSDRVNGSLITTELKDINIVDGVINVGTVTSSVAGGIAGETGPVNISGSRVSGSITAYGNACGLIGLIRSNASVNGNFVDVTVSGTGKQYNEHINPTVCLMTAVSGGSSGGSGNYYHDNGGNIAASYNSNFSATKVYSVTAPAGFTAGGTSAVSFNGVDYYTNDATVTLTAKTHEIIEEIAGVTASNAGVTFTIAPNKRSATFTMPSEDVSITATTTEIHTVGVPENIIIKENAYVTIGTTKFYKTGQTVTFDFSGSGSVVYFVNGEPIVGNSVTVGQQDLMVQIGIPYIDENGKEQICKPGEYSVLTSSTGVSNLSGGWYVVQGEVSYTSTVTFNENAYLILADGATMEIKTKGKYEDGINAHGNLSIYGQGKQSGTLNVTATGDRNGINSYGNITISGGSVTATGYYLGIFGSKGVSINGGMVTATGSNNSGIHSSGNITISGGTVTATGSNSSGIHSDEGNITISGGTVTATGSSDDGIHSDEGNITISGGTVTATGKGSGIDAKGVTISGGTVTASGYYHGIYADNDITLSWTNSTDFIKASSYYSDEGSVQIAKGKSFKDEKGYVYRGTLNAGQLSSLKGQKIEPFEGVCVSFVDNFSEASEVIAAIPVDGEGHVAAPPKHPIHRGYMFDGWFTTADGDTKFDFTATITQNTTAYAHWKENTPVEYIDENGETNTVTDYVLLTNDMYVDDLPDGWYVVQGEVSYTSTVGFSKDAHLILVDGAKMRIETEKNGINAYGNLTIYGQSEQSGTLNVTASGTCIYGNNGVTISGGTVTATGNDYGIYGGNGVTIIGGSVTATGNDGIFSWSDITIICGSVTATGKYGIYGNNGVTISGGTVEASGSSYGIYGNNGVTISGGTVEATDGNYGIYSRNGNITISGGTVEATGDYSGINAQNDITLGWTNSTDFIKASSYASNKGSIQIAEGKSLKDEDGNVYSDKLSSTQLDVIKNKPLKPCYAVTLNPQNGSDPVVVAAAFDENGVAYVAKPADPTRDGFTFEGWFTTTDGNTEFDFSAAITGNTTAYAKWSVPYIDENGKEQIRKPGEYTVLTSSTDVSNLSGGWYVVQGKVKYSNQVKFNGDAHLILADEAKLEIETEGESEHGIYASNNLTIYGQNGQSGILNDTAKGTYGYGIYSRGNITISGGSVTATGDYGGIYSYNGVTISGGTVTASGNNSGINAKAGDITLGWTNSTDFIKVSSIHLGADSCTVSIAEGKSLKDEKGIVYTGKLTDENLEYIKNKTLTPFMPFPDNIVIANISDTTYTGDSIRLKPDVTIGENVLELGKDYTLAYKDNLNASDTAKVIVNGAGKYYGEVQKSFTIDKAPLKITALNDTITYGDEPTNQGVAYEGFVGNETSEVLKGELALKIDYKQYDDAGKYAITPSGLEADNYEIEFVAGELAVLPKVLIVRALNKTIAYGDEPSNAGVEYDGFAGEENEKSLSGELDFTYGGYKQYGDVGEYAITPSGLSAKNYKVKFVAGTLTVEPKTVLNSGAVQILEDEKGKRAEIDGAYKTNKEVVKIPNDIKVDSVVFKRTFTENKSSTIMLPFSIDISKVKGAKFFQITDIEVNITDDGVKKDTVWGPVMISQVTDKIEANTPYLLKPSKTSLSFDTKAGVTLNTSKMNPYIFTKEGVQWEFRGTYHYFDFGSDSTQLIKKSYGFAAADQANGLKVGQFRWTGSESYILPMRGYLVYKRLKDDENGDESGEPNDDGDGNGNSAGGAKPQMLKANAPSWSLYSTIPETLDVEIVDEKGGRTVIGTINTRTGEIRLTPRPKHTYDLKGRRVNESRKAKGVYVEK